MTVFSSVLPALCTWARYFFQPCPHGRAALYGASLATLLAGTLLLCLYLGLYGWERTARLMPSTPSFLLALLHNTAAPAHGMNGMRAAPAAASQLLHGNPPPWRQEALTFGPWRSGVDAFVRGRMSPDTLPYEETPNAPMAEGVKQVDYALTQTLLRLDMNWNSLHLISCERRPTPGAQAGRAPSLLRTKSTTLPWADTFLFQRLRVYAPLSETAFVDTLNEMLSLWGDRATLHREGAGRMRIDVDSVPTHEVFFSRLAPGARAALPAATATVPMLTIVVDDLGASLEAAQRVLGLGVPVTMAIWPRAAHAGQIGTAAGQAGQEVLLHQPMEPMRYPSMQPGPGALFTGMSAADIAEGLSDSLRRVPQAVGVNNHMGSRFTTDRAVSRALSTAAAARGLFVLDSLTHPRSVLAAQARELGVTAYRRAVFLDDPLNRASIRAALLTAERIALRTGQAVAIGHPHPETLDVLRDWLRTRDQRIRLVPLRALRPEPLPGSAVQR